MDIPTSATSQCFRGHSKPSATQIVKAIDIDLMVGDIDRDMILDIVMHNRKNIIRDEAQCWLRPLAWFTYIVDTIAAGDIIPTDWNMYHNPSIYLKAYWYLESNEHDFKVEIINRLWNLFNNAMNMPGLFEILNDDSLMVAFECYFEYMWMSLYTETPKDLRIKIKMSKFISANATFISSRLNRNMPTLETVVAKLEKKCVTFTQ
jgi:hypothetical protein